MGIICLNLSSCKIVSLSLSLSLTHVVGITLSRNWDICQKKRSTPTTLWNDHPLNIHTFPLETSKKTYELNFVPFTHTQTHSLLHSSASYHVDTRPWWVNFPGAVLEILSSEPHQKWRPLAPEGASAGWSASGFLVSSLNESTAPSLPD